ncbi:GntR family transcriptional regulator [Wenjunlia vitaminophila]|uniref:GntR family transcriptional regulator n=1 Tax=Wenjunlia vitaminophila TaxID=76728 RepID=A0A0T6LWK6_WENVI|nr:PLP-dependent aminotransferase family protein [Wenjunlia vitaminophila]KRV50491.1 GntR family transcriptional regulator [Wenjunlia vitaminophila]
MAQWTSSVGAARMARLLASGGPGRGPAYRRLAAGVRSLVTEGGVPVGARLPAERELARALGVSRTTVAAAFEVLREEGFLRSRRGAGSWTALPSGHVEPAQGVHPVAVEHAGRVIDLGSAALAAPEPWLSLAARGAAEELAAFTGSHGYYQAGLPALREELAARYTARGVPTAPEQILVSSGGAMGALTLLMGLLVRPADRVAVEAPGYANVLAMLARCGARRVPVGIGAGGWDMEAWRRVLREAAPRLAYVIPDFHNPTGVLVGDDQRRELVERARAVGAVVLVDETMVDLALDPWITPARPVAAFDRAGSTVVTVGSAGKVFWGGLRIGWVRAAPALVRRMAAARVCVDLGTPVLEQLVVLRLLTDHLEPVLGAQRDRLRAGRDALAVALRRELPEWEFTVPGGGMTLWVRTAGLSGSRLAAAGERLGVRLASGPRFGVDGAFESFLRLPFTVGEAVAREAVARLVTAASEVREGGAAEETEVFVA